MLAVGAASNASALILSGGPVYNLPGGGSCTVTGIPGNSPSGATVSCTGVNLGAHTKVYFGVRNDTNANGNTMDGAVPSGAAIFRFLSSTSNSVTYSSSTTITDVLNGILPVSNRMVLTLTAGSATLVSAGGNPVDNANGDIQRLFQITSGSSFTVRVDVQASDANFALGYALTGLYNPTHTPPSGSPDVSKVDVAFYYSDCGDGVVDSPEQCDQGGANGTSGSCCTASCTFRSSGETCRPGAGAPCDVSETCTGVSALCPSDDALLNLGNVCRAGSGDVCDQNEVCTGIPGQGCPPDDAPTNTSIVCRVGSVGDFCDQPEMCTGVPGATCPADDAPTKINVVCRPGSGDLCDPDERCTGIPGQGCPADIVANPSTVCRAGSGDLCDPNEFCTAVPGQPCPANVVAPSSTVCRSSAGTCDVAEQCTGVAGQQCPNDGKAPATTPCNDDNDVCTVDACDGSGACVFGSALNCQDGNSCTQDSCDPQAGCQYSGTPSNSCTSASKAVLKLRDSASNSADSVKFLWKGGPALVPDMGDPTQSTRYELCIYDSRGVQMAMGVPPGAGWSPLGPLTQPKGFKFKDNAALNDGVKLIKTKGSNLDRGQVKVIGKGNALPDTEDLPLQYPVIAQVYASDGMCWEAQFSMSQTKKNDSGKFAAIAP
ncbi:MAG TPA: hypothetical protein VL049_06075 [Candidatus Dormibacteraeota bacterium]|nr:hypothetical protein [Candidatus Dormibacteraeota bacterium]